MPPQDDSPYPRHPPERPAATAFWPVLVAVVLAGATAAYYFWLGKTPASPPQPPTRAESGPAKAPARVEPAIRHPLDATQLRLLPALDESDAPLWEALAELLGRKTLAGLLKSENIVRHIVATVDNLPREIAPSRVMPLTPTRGAFVVKGKGADAIIGPANPARYANRLRVLQAVDARRLVDLYLYFYPLFQKAYAELGYPGRYFNDRLIEALDDLLAAPEIMTPVKLIQPKVLHQYADSGLEARSAGQKIMIRIGVGNQGLVKAKLREIRREILSRARKQ